MTLMIRVKRKQVILSRERDGADFGVAQRLLAVYVPTGKRLFWWPGHTSWQSRGQSGWNRGVLCVDTTVERTMPASQHEDKTPGRTLAQVLKNAEAFIRSQFLDEEAVLCAIDPHKTIEVRHTDRRAR